MKDRQLFELNDSVSALFLEKELNKIIDSAVAIQAITYCIHAKDSMDQKKEGGDFNYLDNVTIGQLVIAVKQIADAAELQASSVCEKLGLSC